MNLKRIFDIFFSLYFTVFLSIIFIIAQAVATLLPNMQEAWKYVYETKWFELIMWLLAFNLIGVMIKFKTYKKLPVFILHISILVILLGAAITRYFG
jgi:hypothetical protein